MGGSKGSSCVPIDSAALLRAKKEMILDQLKLKLQTHKANMSRSREFYMRLLSEVKPALAMGGNSRAVRRKNLVERKLAKVKKMVIELNAMKKYWFDLTAEANILEDIIMLEIELMSLQ
jgi:hypothetical protein